MCFGVSWQTVCLSAAPQSHLASGRGCVGGWWPRMGRGRRKAVLWTRIPHDSHSDSNNWRLKTLPPLPPLKAAGLAVTDAVSSGKCLKGIGECLSQWWPALITCSDSRLSSGLQPDSWPPWRHRQLCYRTSNELRRLVASKVSFSLPANIFFPLISPSSSEIVENDFFFYVTLQVRIYLIIVIAGDFFLKHH